MILISVGFLLGVRTQRPALLFGCFFRLILYHVGCRTAGSPVITEQGDAVILNLGQTGTLRLCSRMFKDLAR